MNTTIPLTAAATTSAAAIEHAIKKLENVHISKCVLVASVTLLFFDWLLTLDEEIQLVWPSRWGASKVLFFANRYLAFVDPIMLVYIEMFGSGATVCVKGFQILGALSAFGIVTAELILGMRTWAIWERRKSITVLIISFILCCVGVDAYVLFRYFDGVSYIPSPSSAIKGCLLGFKTRIVFWDFVLVMMTETLMLVLLVIKALQHFRHSRSNIMVCMYRDGIFYFVFILVVSIANVCTVLTAPVELHNFLIVLQRVLHSMLCSRVLLHIRGAYTNRGFVMSSDIEESRNGAGFSFRKPHRHTFNEGDSAFALTGNLSPGQVRFSTIGYPTPPTSASKEEFEMIGWGRGRGYADNNVFHSRAFDVPSCEYIVSPVSPSERSRSRTPSSVWP